MPRGALTSSVYPEYRPEDVAPFFNIGGLWRWNNGADAVWTLDGQANITGGGTAEATSATATWDAQPELDDQLHDRARRRQPDPFERPVLSLRLEHVHGEQAA